MNHSFTKLASLIFMGGIALGAYAYEEIELGVQYRFSADDPTYLQWTAPSDGILTVEQYGTSDSHLFANEECTQLIPSDGYTQPTAFYELPYAVSGGTTYYFTAPLETIVDGVPNTEANLIAAIFTFKATEIDAEPITIGESVALKENGPVRLFIPDISGILSIESNSWASYPYILFSNSALTQNVGVSEVADGTSGIIYKFEVTEGKSYYLYSEISATYTLLSLEPNEIDSVSLIYVDPAPGSIIDANYASGVIVGFSPAHISASNAACIYTPAGSSTVTEEKLSLNTVTAEKLNWQIGLDDNALYYIANGKAEPGTYINVVIYNVEYEGIPVTTTTLNNSFIEIADGNITLSYYVPAEEFSIVEAKWPETLYSSWVPDEKDGIATLVFNEDIQSIGEASMVLGHQYYGSPGNPDDETVAPSGNIQTSFNGNELTLNFTNLKLSGNYSEATVFITGIVSVTGQRFNVTEQGVLTKYLPYLNEPSPLYGGVDEIIDDSGEVIYFNLQGMKVTNPKKGEIVIRIQDGKSSVIRF